MLVFHRGWMKYILSDRGDSGGVSVMRGDSGKGDCGWGDCGWGDSGWLPGHTGVGIPVGGAVRAHGDTGWCSQNQGYCYHRALL